MTHTEMIIEASKIKNELARNHWEFADKLDNITVSINTRLRTTAGKAKHREQLIELSYYIFREEENRDNFKNTVTHELAHLLVGCNNGHNAQWKQMHRRLGGSSERCHKMTAGVRQTARDHRAVCQICGEEVPITKRKYNSMRKKIAQGAKYRHKTCRGLFTVKGPNEYIFSFKSEETTH